MIAARLRSGEDVVAPRLVIREQACVQIAESNLHRARQRREVQHVCRAFLACVPQCVGEHESSFRIRVRDLDRLAVRRAQDVARTERVATDEVLRGGDDRQDADRQLELRCGGGAGDHGRPAGHVAFHVVHLQSGLQRDPARVERDRLADKADHCVALRTWRLVTEDDEPRAVHARAPDRAERAHAELVDLLRIEGGDLEVRTG